MKRLGKKSCFLKNVFLYSFALCLISMAGCGGPALSSVEQITKFENTGSTIPQINLERLIRARLHTGPYRPAAGDILELQMPAVLQATSSGAANMSQNTAPYLCRVSADGTIVLPAIGPVRIAGKGLAEIEALVAQAYYPDYTPYQPTVIAKVKEYATREVIVVGETGKTGVYSLRSDEMSLVGLLMKANGIADSVANVVTIKHSDNFMANESNKSKNRSQPTARLSRNDDRPVKNIDLRFEQVNPSNSRGYLTASRDMEILHAAVIDITSEQERTEFVDNLTDSNRNTQCDEIMDALNQLARNIMSSLNIIPDKRKLPEAKRADSTGLARPVTPRTDSTNNKTVVLPVKGLDVPFADVLLHEGDIIEINKPSREVFTVVGPVKNAGVFPYPADIRYNLIQALAFAGGVDMVLDPRYVTIHRQDAAGRIVPATFQLGKNFLTDAADIWIKPGDVVSVELTPRTRTRMLFRELL